MNTTQTITDLSNPKTFEQVFNEYYAQLASFSYQYVKSHDTAEEIVQEMFSSIWIKVESIEIRTSVKSYLFGAVRNACLNYLKHQKIERKYEEHELHKPDFHDIDFLELDELQDKIDEALKSLPDKCREIFEMSRFEEKKYKEIAENLGLSIKTVETQMSRALKVMRNSLGKYLPITLLIILSWMLKNL